MARRVIAKRPVGVIPPPMRLNVSNIVQQSKIGEIMPVSSLKTSDDSKKTIESCFSSFRKIPEGHNNLPLAIIAGVIDYSVSFTVVDIIEGIYKELYTYQDGFTSESENIFNLIKTILDLIKNTCELQAKFEALERIYTESTYDLAILMRNIMMITVKKLYHRSEYKDFRMIKSSIDEILDPIIHLNSTSEIEDFRFFLDYFNINLRFVDIKTLDISSISSNTKYVIHLYQDDFYYTLHTIEESMLKTLSYQDYLNCLNFIKNYEEQPQANFSDLNEKKIAAQKEKDEVASFFFSVGSITTSNPGIEETIKISGENNREFIEELFENYECNYCSELKTVREIECGHKICDSCFNYNNDKEYLVCKKCNFTSSMHEIIQKNFR